MNLITESIHKLGQIFHQFGHAKVQKISKKRGSHTYVLHYHPAADGAARASSIHATLKAAGLKGKVGKVTSTKKNLLVHVTIHPTSINTAHGNHFAPKKKPSLIKGNFGAAKIKEALTSFDKRIGKDIHVDYHAKTGHFTFKANAGSGHGNHSAQTHEWAHGLSKWLHELGVSNKILHTKIVVSKGIGTHHVRLHIDRKQLKTAYEKKLQAIEDSIDREYLGPYKPEVKAQPANPAARTPTPEHLRTKTPVRAKTPAKEYHSLFGIKIPLFKKKPKAVKEYAEFISKTSHVPLNELLNIRNKKTTGDY
jgi:hypothetical protein